MVLFEAGGTGESISGRFVEQLKTLGAEGVAAGNHPRYARVGGPLVEADIALHVAAKN